MDEWVNGRMNESLSAGGKWYVSIISLYLFLEILSGKSLGLLNNLDLVII